MTIMSVENEDPQIGNQNALWPIIKEVYSQAVYKDSFSRWDSLEFNDSYITDEGIARSALFRRLSC